MSIINKGKTFSNGEQLTAEKLNDLVDLAAFDQSATDSASTTVNTSGQIVVKDGGVSTPKIADTAVTTAKIADGQVTPAKLSTGAPEWGTNGQLFINGGQIEINPDLVGDSGSYIDFHSTSASEPNYDARVSKDEGEDSNFHITNEGSGQLRLTQNDQIKFQTSGGNEGFTKIYSGGTGANGAHIELYGSAYPGEENNGYYDANRHRFRSAAGGTNPSYVDMNMTDEGDAELVIQSADSTGEANLKLSSFTPSIIFEDRTGTSSDFQITANGGALKFLNGHTSGDAPLTNEIVKIKSTDEVEIKGNLLINNVVDKPAILIEDTASGTVDREGEMAVPVGDAFSLGFWDAAAAVGSRFISKLRFNSSLIYLRSKLRIGGTTDDASDPLVYIDGIREGTTDELRLSADRLTFYTNTDYATKAIDATGTKVSIDPPLEVSTISGPEDANVLTLKADPESPDSSEGGAQIGLHSSDSSVPNQIYAKSAFTYFQNMAGNVVASIGSSGPVADKDLATKEYVDNGVGFTTIKAHCVWDPTLTGTNAPISGSGVTSVTRNGAGNWTINLSVTAPLSNFVTLVSSDSTGGTINAAIGAYSTSTTTVSVRREGSNGIGHDGSNPISFAAIW